VAGCWQSLLALSAGALWEGTCTFREGWAVHQFESEETLISDALVTLETLGVPCPCRPSAPMSGVCHRAVRHSHHTMPFFPTYSGGSLRQLPVEHTK
jgi:hypothetical protein